MSKEPTKRDDKDEHRSARDQAQHQTDEERMERERWQREDPAYLEKTRPEDPSSRQGQLTRDNVNPNIPSGKQGEPPGPIVDPKSLGMEQGGVAPKNPMQPQKDEAKPREEVQPREGEELQGSIHSINEPPGSDVTPDVPPPPPPEGRATSKADEVDEPDLSDPDEMEEELDEAVEEGDAKPVRDHRTPPSKRKK